VLAIPPLFLVLVVLAVAFLPHLVTGERIRTEAVSALTATLGVPVEIGKFEYDPTSQIEITDLVIGPPQGFKENILRIDRAVVRYELSGILDRRVAITEVSLNAPVIVLETQRGRTNIDALLANLASDAAPVEQAEPSEGGPLLPIDIDLGALEIAPITVVLAGEGPNAKLEHARLSIAGQAGRERLDLKLHLAVDADEHDNMSARLDPSIGISARTTLALDVEVHSATANGLALEKATAKIEGESRVSATWDGGPIEPAVMSFAVESSVEPGADTAKVERVELKLDGAPLVSAKAELDGIAALVAAFAGDAVVKTLGASIGLVDRKRSGSANLSVERVSLPLDHLAKWVKLFVPDLELAGNIHVAKLDVSGTAREVAAGTPSKMELEATLDGVNVRMPSAELAVRALQGKITGGKKEQRYGIDGALQIEQIAQAKNVLGPASVELALAVDRLLYPQTRKTDARVHVALATAVAPPARVKKIDATVELAGIDPLSVERGLDPIKVRASVDAGSVRVKTATNAIDVGGVKVTVEAALDRLLDAARQPIAAQVAVAVARASTGKQKVERARLKLDAEVKDPRAGWSAADAKIELAIGAAHAHPVHVKDAKVKLGLVAEDIRARPAPGFPGGAPPMLPQRVGVKLSVTSPALSLTDRDLGDLATPVSLETSLNLDPAAATLAIEKLSVDVQDILTVLLKGRANRLYSDSPWVDAELGVGPVRLDKLAAKIPRGLLKEIPDLTAEGSLTASVKATGTIPDRFEETALVRQPISGRVRIAFDGVGVASKRKSILLQQLDGTVIADVRDGKVETHTELDAARIVQGRPPLQNEIQKLSVRNQVRLQEDVWTVASHIRAESVRSAYGGEGAVQGASIDLDVNYPQRGDLELARFDVHAPGNGIELATRGRLRRGAFGVFRPDLSVDARLDLDRLRHLLPQLSGGRGKAAFVLSVASKVDRIVEVEGRFETDRFSWEVPKVLTVLNASGRIPISQRLLLPAPALDDSVARSVGALGDDFEARADEMVRHFERARAVLDTEDILIEAPRTADYQSLRPYYASTGARLTIEGIVYEKHAIEDVILEGLWSSGVLRIDRLACRLWEGDVLGDLAVQFTPDQNVRMRMRGTITDLNIDLPYAMAKRVEPISDPDEKEDYRVSGQMDFEFSLKQRAVNARVDLTKVKLPLLRTVFGAVLSAESPALWALEVAQMSGVRPTSGKIWISNNLLSVSFDWERLWVHMSLDQETFMGKVLDAFLILGRWALIPTLGGYVIKTVNETIRNFSISAVLDDAIGRARVEDQLRFLEGRVIAADRAASSLPDRASADMLSPR
jgi:hypothetical protein